MPYELYITEKAKWIFFIWSVGRNLWRCRKKLYVCYKNWTRI